MILKDGFLSRLFLHQILRSDSIKSKTYSEFVEKFKPKKTTDDCYTPPKVYEVIKDYVINYYKPGADAEIVRPFYPGGDYENFDYPKNAVVIDNPPFSILREIKKFYCEKNIKFFLFAPYLTIFSGRDDKSVCYVLTNTNIIYENGADIATSFVTNLDEFRIRTDPKLKEIIDEVQKADKKQLRYKYPANVISSALLSKHLNRGLEIKFKNEDLHFIRRLDSQKQHKKGIFGAGYLISDEKAEELKLEIENDKEVDNIWTLSEREKEIIKNLGD